MNNGPEKPCKTNHLGLSMVVNFMGAFHGLLCEDCGRWWSLFELRDVLYAHSKPGRYTPLEEIADDECTCTPSQLSSHDPTLCRSCTAKLELTLLANAYRLALKEVEETEY